MNFIKKFLMETCKSYLQHKSGKPILFFNSFRKLIHNWISDHLDEDDMVLDIGARKFPYTRYQNIKAVFGVDLLSESNGYLGYSKNELEIFKSQKILFPIIANCEDLPFKDNSFDKAVMIEVIEHIKMDKRSISEVARVLKKDGELLITTPNGEEVENTNPFHFRHYTFEEFKAILEKHFENVKVTELFPNVELYVRQLYPEDKLLLRIFWYYVYELWLNLYGKKHYSAGGYTLVALCKYPRT